jgi:TonB family protein
MNLPGIPENDKLFSRYLIYSFVLHIIVLLFALFLSDLNRWRIPPQTQVTWIQLGGGLGKEEGLPFKETKTLPQTTIEEQKKATFEQPPPTPEKPLVKPEKKVEEAEKEKVMVEEKKKKLEEKKESPKKTVEGKVQEAKIKEALAKINEDLKKPTPIPEAAQVKEGGPGSPQGEVGGSNSECSIYSARVKQRIVGNWIRIVGTNLPPRPPKISVTIDASGNIISTVWIQKSGDLSLDSSALRAIQNSSPLPAPSENCELALRGGIIVQFGR